MVYFQVPWGKRLSNIGVENTEDNRRFYRQMLFQVHVLMIHFIDASLSFNVELISHVTLSFFSNT